MLSRVYIPWSQTNQAFKTNKMTLGKPLSFFLLGIAKTIPIGMFVMRIRNNITRSWANGGKQTRCPVFLVCCVKEGRCFYAFVFLTG